MYISSPHHHISDKTTHMTECWCLNLYGYSCPEMRIQLSLLLNCLTNLERLSVSFLLLAVVVASTYLCTFWGIKYQEILLILNAIDETSHRNSQGFPFSSHFLNMKINYSTVMALPLWVPVFTKSRNMQRRLSLVHKK